MKKQIIAIDLHGTLLNEEWLLPQSQQEEFYLVFDKLKNDCDFYICTGNDYSFLTRYLSEEFLSCFQGFVLETGAVSWQAGVEKVLIDTDLIDKIKRLESDLKREDFRFIHYFATRKASVSMFTHTEKRGTAPIQHVHQIQAFMQQHPLEEHFKITYSNVAIDIIPKQVNKYTGALQMAQGRKIISLLDSMNDYDLAINSDLCFLPANSSKELLASIEYKSIDEYDQKAGVYLCKNSFSEGVLEALKLLSL
ncbi:MAG TPA: HAD hydrolase family protein [Candidatus Cloacimonadota bacterium]|nr:HAD hydrolase family protein [Candidatus Cloacimonadota bacterium]